MGLVHVFMLFILKYFCLANYFRMISRAIKSHIFSVLQETMKRILKQKLHPYEVNIKSCRVIKSNIFHVRL